MAALAVNDLTKQLEAILADPIKLKEAAEKARASLSGLQAYRAMHKVPKVEKPKRRYRKRKVRPDVTSAERAILVEAIYYRNGRILLRWQDEKLLDILRLRGWIKRNWVTRLGYRAVRVRVPRNFKDRK